MKRYSLKDIHTTYRTMLGIKKKSKISLLFIELISEFGLKIYVQSKTIAIKKSYYRNYKVWLKNWKMSLLLYKPNLGIWFKI